MPKPVKIVVALVAAPPRAACSRLAAGDEAALEAVRVAALGKKGSISALLATLGKMSPDERKTVAGKRNVAILEVHPIGNYAVRLVFDDMHSTGIYSWDYLHGLGRNRDANWQDYLDELAVKGMSR